jgi:hypothetical protein
VLITHENLLSSAQATMMMGVPTLYARLVEDPAFPNAIGKNFSWLSLA